MSYNKIGDVLAAQGNLPDSLRAYRDSLGIAERLAQSGTGNAGWQRDLSVSHAKPADVFMKSNDRANARRPLTEGRAIIAGPVAKFPDRADWKQDLAWFDAQIRALK